MEEALKFIGARPSGGCVGPGEGAGGGSAPWESLHSSASPETPAGRHVPAEVSIGHHRSLDTLGTQPCPGGDLPHQGGDIRPPPNPITAKEGSPQHQDWVGALGGEGTPAWGTAV